MPNNSTRAQNEQAAIDAQRHNRQQWLVIGAVSGIISAIVLGLAVILIGATRPPPGLYDRLTQTTSAEGFPILGDPNTALVIAEITDFNCVPCSTYYQINDAQIIDAFVRNGRARLTWVLTGTNANTTAIDQAALCALAQHKFWVARDALFAYQSRFAPAQAASDAFSLGMVQDAIVPGGVNRDQIAACVNDSLTLPILNAGQAFQSNNKVTNVPILLWRVGNTPWQPFLGSDNQPYVNNAPPIEILGRTIDFYYSTAAPGVK